MLKVAGIVLILLTPTLAGVALLAVIKVSGRLARRARERRHGVAAGVPPLERVAEDLRRLHRDLLRLEDAPDTTPGRQVRIRALRCAYGDSLVLACRALDVALPAVDLSRAPAAEIYRLEAALRDRGLDVAPTAIR